MFDKDITVINKYYDKPERISKYKVSHVKGFWSSNDGISINGTLIQKADGYVAMILKNEKGYQSPKDFEEKQIGWTLKPDDYLVKGIVEDFTTISKLTEDYEEVMKITTIGSKDYGSEDMQHFDISGN